MTGMPGNPYTEVLDADYLMTEDTKATLALAFEVRTANLIAVAVAQDRRGIVGDRYWNEVAERLGMEDGDE